jgi:hypothetical protein
MCNGQDHRRALSSASQVGPGILSAIAWVPLRREWERALWPQPPVPPLRSVDLPPGRDGEVRVRASPRSSSTFGLPPTGDVPLLRSDVCFVTFE